MATRTVKARVELDGEKQYKQALSELNSGNKVLASEMRKLQAEYKGNADSVEFLNKKGDLLQRQLQQQRDKVKTLQEAVAKSAQQYGEADKKTQDWIIKLNNAEAAEYDLEHAIEENNDAIKGQNKEMSGLGDVVKGLTDKLGIQLPKGATNALNGMTKLSSGTVAAMGAAAAGVMAMVKAVKELQETTLEAAEKADEIVTKSTQMNISAQQYQALQYASPFVDVDVDSMASSLAKITKAMGDAQAGGESAMAAFSDLGISITNTDGTLRDSYDVWLDTMDALAKMGNETERDIAAQQLLGKSAATFAPIYREGTEALRDYTKAAEDNYVMSDEQLEALTRVDDAVQHLHLTQEANKNMIAAQWAPTVEKALTTFDNLFQAAGKALVDSGIITAFGNLVQLAISMLEPVTALFKAADDAPGKLSPVETALRGIAYVLATIQDSINVIRGLLPWNWGSGLTRTALGWNTDQGQLSATGKLYYGDTSSYGWTYDELQGAWVSNSYGHNASGNHSWKGGLTWVGEAGPELVNLPRGSQIYNNQDSMNMGGTNNYYINVNGIEELEQVVRWYEGRQVAARMMG